MPNKPTRAFHREEVNCTPWSDVTSQGVPKWDTHSRRKLQAQVSAVVDERGMASG